MELILQPMVHVAAMAPALDFYAALGATVLTGSPDGDFAVVRLGDAQLGLLAHPPNPAQGEGMVELNLLSTTPLDEVERQLRAAGVDVLGPPVDQEFGAQLQVRTPDGLLVKINSFDPDRFD